MNINFLNFKTMKTMKTIKFFSIAALTVGMLASCSDNELPEDIEGEDEITRLELTFTSQSDITDTVTLKWDDENEDEEIQESEKTVEGSFKSGVMYDAEIALFNKEEDFLEEDILENQLAIDAHFFVYSSSLDFMMSRASNDNARSDNNKLGVKTTWTAPSSGTGTIGIKLYHESPTVSDSDGFGTAVGDDTDIDITFNISVQSRLVKSLR